MLRVILFTILSTALASISRASLKVPHSHDFYRFIAWKCILRLFVLNFISFAQWFSDPLSVGQVISWSLLISCIVPAVYGSHLLHAGSQMRDAPAMRQLCGSRRRLAVAGTFSGVRPGMKATGNQVRVAGVDIDKVIDG